MTTTVRITDSEGLLSTIPVLIGFHPTDSLVVAGVQAYTQHVGPVARFDLADYRREPEEMATYIVSRVGQHADGCILVFYGADEDPIDIAEMIAERGLTVLGVEFAANDPHPLHTAAHAELVVGGRIVAPSREAIRAQVEFDPTAKDAPDWGLVATMRDHNTRDIYLANSIRAAHDPLQRVLASCRAVPDRVEGVANLCATAAILAYRCGDGALAHMCLDRALRVDPEHNLSALMVDVFQMAPRPESFDDLLSGITG